MRKKAQMQIRLKGNQKLVNGSLHFYFFTKEGKEIPFHLNLHMFNY